MTDAGHRVFIAVPLDPGILDAVMRLERRLEGAGVTPRWITPGNLHFTLRFLGRISTAQLDRVRRATREAMEGVGAFQIRLSGVGAFPSVRRPQVVWLGVDRGAEGLKDLARRLDDALARQRFPKEPRAFQPHLTLARIKESNRVASLESAAASLAGVEVGEQVIHRIVVVESHLRPSGALYVPVEEVPLFTHEK